MSRATTFDVAVVGGGPAGAVTALLLARAGRRVLLLERCRPRDFAAGFRGGESLPPQANPVLRRLVLEELVRNGPHLPCHGTVSTWGGHRPVETDFLFSPHGHGWHLDRGAFDGQLLEAAGNAGVVVRWGATLRELQRRKTGWQVTWKNGSEACLETAHARRVVDASGPARVLLRRLGVRTHRFDRLVATVGLGSPSGDAEDEWSDGRSAIEAAPAGWWYQGLLPGGRRIVAAFSDAGSSAAVQLRSRAGFVRELGARDFARGTGSFRVEGPWVRSAASARPARVTGRGWLAVGDAAGSFDPLSSQGMLSALRSAEQAAATLLADLRTGSGLASYEQFQENVYSEYLELRRRFYRQEMRWPRASFWHSRHQPPRCAA